jgi:6-pyruvoyltetrahydropterin/6-carboxytetrahydropterin synthase
MHRINKDNVIFIYFTFADCISIFYLILMLSITKIFTFEMAHAIFGYNGACSNIHGHSYVLHVSVQSAKGLDYTLTPPGFIIDFKELKEIVNMKVISRLDHKLVLSSDYIKSLGSPLFKASLLLFEAEPTAENLLLFISKELIASLPVNVTLYSLKLFETATSYAEWVNN